jgi:hypothetical protein
MNAAQEKMFIMRIRSFFTDSRLRISGFMSRVRSTKALEYLTELSA